MKLNSIYLAIVCFFAAQLVNAQSLLVKNLAAGKHQVLVTYGTSLTAGDGGRAWVNAINDSLNNKYNNNLTTVNAAKSAMWSGWGVQNFEDSVINKKPDAVIIEFGMNDAFLNYKTSPDLAKLNLNYMIDRIKLSNPQCEVILQIMNIPINVHADAPPQYFSLLRSLPAGCC